MRILMLTRYVAMGANSRYRLMQYVPLLENEGHRVEVRPMLGEDYLRELYSRGRKSKALALKGYWKRLLQLRGLQEFDLVICDQEFLPYFPAFVESSIARACRRLIVDYDDAAFIKYRGFPGLKQRIPALMTAADAVVVGNRYLEEYARQYSSNVHVIPTVVDTRRYQVRQDSPTQDHVRLVWIGTPVTAEFLRPIAPGLTALREKYPGLQLRLIGASDRIRDAVPFAEILEWSEAGEASMLSECDIGLMPLPDDEFTRGKCGLKLIQYMAAGLPVVGSPVGANCDIISESEDGFLARQPNEWAAALERLISSAEMRREFGRKGAAKVAREYSLGRGFRDWINLVESRVLPDDRKHTETVSPVRS